MFLYCMLVYFYFFSTIGESELNSQTWQDGWHNNITVCQQYLYKTSIAGDMCADEMTSGKLAQNVIFGFICILGIKDVCPVLVLFRSQQLIMKLTYEPHMLS